MQPDDLAIVRAALDGTHEAFRTTRVTLELPTSIVENMKELARLESEAQEDEPVDWRDLAVSTLAGRFRSDAFMGFRVGSTNPVDKQREALGEAWHAARGAPWGIENGDQAALRLYRRFARRAARMATLLGIGSTARYIRREAEDQITDAAKDRARHGR